MERETFSSSWGAVLTTAGVAIGLGNVWRFPYMMGLYGGSAFLILYLVLVFALGVPALTCEWGLGRSTRKGTLGAFHAVGFPGGKFWGALLLLTVTMAASYYGVVVAWVLDFAAYAVAGRHADAGLFDHVQGSVLGQAPGLVVTVLVACLALGSGVRRGIERVSKTVLPVFFVLFVFLIARVLTLEGAMPELVRFLRPDWSQIDGEVVLAALGQAFFSLALGGTFMVVYGSYLGDKDRLFPQAAATAATDAAAALLAGLAVVPAVLALGLDLASGPALLFQVLPEVFARVPAGQLLAVVFFGSVFLVALLSLMAAYEVVVEALTRHLAWSRPKALLVVGVVELVLAVPALLSVDYVAQSDFLWGTTMQTLGGAIAVVALVWAAGRAEALEELGSYAAPRPVLFWIRWVVPGAIFATLAYGWWERFTAS